MKGIERIGRRERWKRGKLRGSCSQPFPLFSVSLPSFSRLIAEFFHEFFRLFFLEEEEEEEEDWYFEIDINIKLGGKFKKIEFGRKELWGSNGRSEKKEKYGYTYGTIRRSEVFFGSRISRILVKINYRFRIFGFFVVVLTGNKRRVF